MFLNFTDRIFAERIVGVKCRVVCKINFLPVFDYFFDQRLQIVIFVFDLFGVLRIFNFRRLFAER